MYMKIRPPVTCSIHYKLFDNVNCIKLWFNIYFTCDVHMWCSHVIYHFTCDVHMWFWAWDKQLVHRWCSHVIHLFHMWCSHVILGIWSVIFDRKTACDENMWASNVKMACDVHMWTCWFQSGDTCINLPHVMFTCEHFKDWHVMHTCDFTFSHVISLFHMWCSHVVWVKKSACDVHMWCSHVFLACDVHMWTWWIFTYGFPMRWLRANQRCNMRMPRHDLRMSCPRHHRWLASSRSDNSPVHVPGRELTLGNPHEAWCMHCSKPSVPTL